MVMIRMLSNASDINGKFGGVRYRRDNCGLHMEKIPDKRPPEWWKPMPQNKAFGKCTTAYSNHKWLPIELDLWWMWCAAHPRKNKKGDTYYLHPFLAFMTVNIKRLRDGKEIIFVPEPWW